MSKLYTNEVFILKIRSGQSFFYWQINDFTVFILVLLLFYSLDMYILYKKLIFSVFFFFLFDKLFLLQYK